MPTPNQIVIESSRLATQLLSIDKGEMRRASLQALKAVNPSLYLAVKTRLEEMRQAAA